MLLLGFDQLCNLQERGGKRALITAQIRKKQMKISSDLFVLQFSN